MDTETGSPICFHFGGFYAIRRLYFQASKIKIPLSGYFYFAPELKPSQTFEIILPNLIHKSKKRNLH